jgi:hypothetical protein
MNPNHLPRLRSLQHEIPTKRISLIRLAWPDIEKALARGHTLKLVHARLTEDGLRISYRLLSLYVRRLQGKESAKKFQHHRTEATKASLPVQAADPLRGSLRTVEERKEASPPSARKAPTETSEERALWDPSELMGANCDDGAPDGEPGYWFKESVPDINELFRITKSEPAPKRNSAFVNNSVSPP